MCMRECVWAGGEAGDTHINPSLNLQVCMGACLGPEQACKN